MGNRPFISASGTGKDYYYLFSILNFEDIPIVFAAIDQNNQIFLCDCVEFRDIQKWVIAKTDFSILKKVSMQEISVYDALSWDDGTVDFVTLHYNSGEFEHQNGLPISEMSMEDLPDKDSIIRYPEPDVIEQIQLYSLALTMACLDFAPIGKTEWYIDTDNQSSKKASTRDYYDVKYHSRIEKSRSVAA